MKFSTLNPARFVANRAAVLALILLLQQGVNAHSWVEEVTNVAANGTMVGAPGFIRGWTGRELKDGFNEGNYAYIFPKSGRPTNDIRPEDNICPPVQTLGNYSAAKPMLTTNPGNFIALRYAENGHVTSIPTDLSNGQATKPLNRGTVFIYGTTEATNDDKFLDVRAWNAEGTGGNRKGRLLATRNYDDRRCFENKASTPFYNERSKAANMAGLMCQNDFQLPADLALTTANKPLTIYWLWSWPSMNRIGCPTDQEDPNNNCKIARMEFYTSCMDVNVVAPGPNVKAASQPVGYVAGQDFARAADPVQMTVGPWQVKILSSGAAAPAPSSTGTNSKPTPAPTSAPSSTITNKPADKNSRVKTVTKTVPAKTETVTVNFSKPTATAPRRVRRTTGEWSLGHTVA